MKHPFFQKNLIALAILLLSGEFLAAQVQIGLQIPRRSFIVHEPILATLTIRNLSGRDLQLGDENGTPWYGFEITRVPGNAGVGPVDLNYRNPPLLIPNGQVLSRKINIREIYKMQELGIYNMKAFIVLPGTQRSISSNMVQIEITEGRTIYTQSIGVPPDSGYRGNLRTFTLLIHALPKGDRLYARIVDPDLGTIYCTHNLGRVLSFSPPKVLFDGTNEIHILHAISPNSYRYDHLTLDGQVIATELYHVVNKTDIPRMRRFANGTVQVSGGVSETQVQAERMNSDGTIKSQPKISDRPAGIPKP